MRHCGSPNIALLLLLYSLAVPAVAAPSALAAGGENCRAAEEIAGATPPTGRFCPQSLRHAGFPLHVGQSAEQPADGEAHRGVLAAMTPWLWLVVIGALLLAGINSRKKNRQTQGRTRHQRPSVDHERRRG